MQVHYWGNYEVVSTLKTYLLQKNSLELFALTGGGDAFNHCNFLSIGCSTLMIGF